MQNHTHAERTSRQIIIALPNGILQYFFVMEVSCMYVNLPTQASLKGASLTVTGIIIGLTPLAVTIVAPVAGYLVS